MRHLAPRIRWKFGERGVLERIDTGTYKQNRAIICIGEGLVVSRFTEELITVVHRIHYPVPVEILVGPVDNALGYVDLV